jgi:hypothetical protein
VARRTGRTLHPSQGDFRATLRRAGFTHTLYFEMIDEGNRKLYLIFGTQHELGLEKMNPSYGVRYRDPRDTQQQMLDLVFEPDTAPLRRFLRDFISEAPDGRTIADLSDTPSWKPSTGPPK